MTQENISCPHCDGDYFNYAERQIVERVGLRVQDGNLEISGGIAKSAAVTLTCRNCGGEYDGNELAKNLHSC